MMDESTLMGSQPVLTFDKGFDKFSNWRLFKSLFIDTFGTPREHLQSEPFVDGAMIFDWANDKIWAHHYKVIE